MRTNILWTGREYYSLEDCVILRSTTGLEIDSTIIGYYKGQIYHVRYKISTSLTWRTKDVAIDYRLGHRSGHINLTSDFNGKWSLQNQPTSELDGCVDVDIPLTPFTNTLPINRLNLSVGDESTIKVVYIDLFNNSIRAVNQRYQKIAGNSFHYENVPNDFEAVIEVDDAGLVIDYPSLFFRTAIDNLQY
ncbi:MAG: putative glycolipid-binding domain-containing protein [Chitinophagaceae bacterium]|nr:putative glycolipid-binding domain-containing protein [Chitinophagaceae bacterium]